MSGSLDAKIASEKIGILLDQMKDILCEDAINEITHYLDHDEPEIAFEGMFVELMQLGSMPENIDKTNCIELGRYLKLDEETVLDDEFWRKFLKFVGNEQA